MHNRIIILTVLLLGLAVVKGQTPPFVQALAYMSDMAHKMQFMEASTEDCNSFIDSSVYMGCYVTVAEPDLFIAMWDMYSDESIYSPIRTTEWHAAADGGYRMEYYVSDVRTEFRHVELNSDGWYVVFLMLTAP